MAARKKISVIALDPRAGRAYGRDIAGLFGDAVTVSAFSVLDGSAAGLLERADLFAVSPGAYGSAEELARHIPMGCQSVAIEHSFRWQALRKLGELPAGSKAFFVGATKAMAWESVARLEEFGVNHIRWVPFFPGAPVDLSVRAAVTSDEMRYVPPGMTTTIDLGQPPCAPSTMIEIALRLGLGHLLEAKAFQAYFHAVAAKDYSFDPMFAHSLHLESQFHLFIEALREGVVGVDEKGKIFACSRRAGEIASVSPEYIQGKRAEDVFPEIPFGKCLQNREAPPAKIAQIGGAAVSVEVLPVVRQGTCIGAFALLQPFHDAEARQSQLRGQLLQREYRAKYSFADIIGQSEAICKTKEILGRMALNESPILLLGEAGTGKERFAHAIHQSSPRAGGPFVSIHADALPEKLLEIELFGYEDGAIPGAQKGGCPGLFEFAHGGTLFLSGLESLQPALQGKLLQTLRERKTIRTGGTRAIPIDVRLVSASGEALERNIRTGAFCRELFYQLNTLPAVIPPLAERGDDVFLLTEHFRRQLRGTFQLSAPVKEFFRRHTWPGNIRELKNYVEYFVNTGRGEITLEDLPPTLYLSGNQPSAPETEIPAGLPFGEVDAFRFVLSQLYESAKTQSSSGRDKMLQKARELHVPLTQQKVREILSTMAAQGLVEISRGRGGSRLTAKGRALWENG